LQRLASLDITAGSSCIADQQLAAAITLTTSWQFRFQNLTSSFKQMVSWQLLQKLSSYKQLEAFLAIVFN
jgi:hypothetical protein